MRTLMNKRGQGLTEYTLILAAVVVLVGLLVTAFKGPLKTEIDNISQGLSSPGK